MKHCLGWRYLNVITESLQETAEALARERSERQYNLSVRNIDDRDPAAL